MDGFTQDPSDEERLRQPAWDQGSAGQAHVRRTLTKTAPLIAAALIGVAGVLVPIRWLSGLQDTDHSAAAARDSSVTTSLGKVGTLTATTLDVERGITGLAYGFGSVWVAGQQSVSRLDVATGHVAATIPFDGDDYGKVVIGADAVWVTGGGPSVSKIDPSEDAIVATVEVGGNVRGLATGGGYLWVSSTTDGGQLVQMDETDGSVTARLPIPSGPIQFSEGSIWIFHEWSPTEVDAQTLTARRSGLPVQGPAVVDSGYIWSISTSLRDNAPATVSKMAIDTGDVSASTSIPRAAAIGADTSGIWVLSAPGSMSRELYIPDPAQPAVVALIDRDTGLVKAGPVPVDVTPAWIGVGDGSLWISHYDTGVITRVEA